MKKTDLNIIGMHCASCSTLINKTLSRTEGVSEANVNYATSKARIVYDESKLSDQKLISIVRGKGYDAKISDGKNDYIQSEDSKTKELSKIRSNLILGLALSIPAFIIGMILMPMNIDVPYAEIILFLLVTPVQFFVGLDIYRSAIVALKNRLH